LSRHLLFASTIAATSLFGAVSAHAEGADDVDAPARGVNQVDEVVVTGVFGATAIERAPIAVTAITQEEITQQAPISAADALKNVPGVFVNSALGEIRNVVFSRGVSARSLEAAGGYFYVSLQENGLPVEPLLASNFGPDYFTRLDIMTQRIEALRGGTAVVTGANAPGGIFNYISKTGKTAPGTEVQFKYGLEGDGNFPLYRVDAYTAGRIGDHNLYYAVGGFYRESEGPRYPGYKMNKGGQIRGNLLWDYDAGSVTVHAKYLSDHNGWFEPLPARDYNNPKIVTPFNNLSSVLPPPSPHSYVNLNTGKTENWDGSNLVHAKSLSFGVEWRHQLTDAIRLENKFSGSANRADWNTAALVFATQLTDADFGVRAISGNALIDGTYTYRTPDGAVAAVVVQTGGARTVTVNNLPNQNVLSGGGVIAALAYPPQMFSRSIQDQLTLTGEFGRHKLSVGAYVSQSAFKLNLSGGGGGVMTLESRPVLLSTTLTRPDGTVYQVTDPAGWAGIGNGLEFRSRGTRLTTMSLFGGDTWEVNDRLTLDAGLRYEKLTYDTYTYENVAATGDPLTSGGRDGNPLTLYDAGTIRIGSRIEFKRDYDYLAYTGSAAYKISDGLQAYIRYTRGEKAPDLGIIGRINSVVTAATLYPAAEVVKQAEIGVKYRRGGLFLQAFPFWSENSKVADGQIFVYLRGPNAGQSYSPPPVFGTIETYGVEFSGDVDVSEKLSLRANLTLQRPKARDFGAMVQGPKADGTDDVVLAVPAGDADNNPKVIFRGTAVYQPIESVSLFATYNYLGERAANRFNTFYLPGFATVDLGGAWKVTDKVRLQANVTNLFDKAGIMSWTLNGAYIGALNRQAFTPAQRAANPNQLFGVIPIQPRAFFVTATIAF